MLRILRGPLRVIMPWGFSHLWGWEFPEVPTKSVKASSWSVERYKPVFSHEPIPVVEMRGFLGVIRQAVQNPTDW
eukprot:8225581-Pyramimonas_sp.AAC.1